MGLSVQDILTLLAAVALAGIGGECFLRGVLGAAAVLRVPKLLVATSLAACATSSPELTVSTVAALSGAPEIGLGDALGSNVVNIALVFGLALLFGPIRVARDELGRDFGLALALPILSFWFAADGAITRGEGAVLLSIFVIWMGMLIRSGLACRESAGTKVTMASSPAATPGDVGSAAGNVSGMPGVTSPGQTTPFAAVQDDFNRGRFWLSPLLGLTGLAALIFAGKLFVGSATGIAAAFGVDAYIVGVIVVAIGTSLPELVTVLLARIRGHDDIGVGTLLGSNLFNGMGIVGVAASIHPIRAPLEEIAITLAVGLLSLLLLIPGRNGIIGRGRGVLLLATYSAFVVATMVIGRAD